MELWHWNCDIQCTHIIEQGRSIAEHLATYESNMSLTIASHT